MLGAPVARGAGREKRGLLKPILVVALCAFFGAWFYELLEFSSETGVHHRSQGHDAQHAAPGPEAHAPTPAVATPRTTPEVAQTPVAASFDPISPSLWYFRRDVAEYLQNSVTINRTIPAPLPPIAKACPDATCSSHGYCEPITGQCQCHIGWTGLKCSEPVFHGCNPEGPEGGFWILSRCGGECNEQMSTCHCPNHTKFPGRLLPADTHHEGEKPAHFSGVGRTYPKGWIWGTGPNVSHAAWCDLDPKALTPDEKRELKRIWTGTEFHCKSPSGEFPCDQLYEACLNGCSGHGTCKDGVCHCDKGFGSADCAVRVVGSASERTAAAAERGKDVESLPKGAFEAPKWLRRPLIYMYELPPHLNVGMSAMSPWYCWYRNSGDGPNGLFWGMETFFPELLLHSAHRTTDPELADFFYVPVFDGCSLALHHHNKRAYDLFPAAKRYPRGMTMQEEALKYIRGAYPFWNRTGGKDHLLLAVADEGSCLSSGAVWNATFLTHWGNWADRPRSTSAYIPDDWSDGMADRVGIIYRVNGQKRTLEEMRGVRPCYEPDKDIVVPSWKWSWRFPNSIYLEKADGDAAKGMEMELADLTGRNRTLLFAFAGDFGGQWGRSERWYSQGIRFSLYTRFGNARAKDFPEVALKAGHIIGQDGYNELLRSAIFCGAMPGDGYSARLEDSLMNGCIPVIIQDYVHLAFESYLDFDAFSIRIPQIRMKDLVKILKAVPEAEIRAKQRAVMDVRRRFSWQSAVKRTHGGRNQGKPGADGRVSADTDYREHDGRRDALGVPPAEDPSGPFAFDTDTFGTIMQILAFKAANDPWRIEYRKELCARGDVSKCDDGEARARKHLGYLGGRTPVRAGAWGEVRKYGSTCEPDGKMIAKRWAGAWDGEALAAPDKGIPDAPPRTCVRDTVFLPKGFDSDDCEMRLAGDLGCISFLHLGYTTRVMWPHGDDHPPV